MSKNFYNRNDQLAGKLEQGRLFTLMRIYNTWLYRPNIDTY